MNRPPGDRQGGGGGLELRATKGTTMQQSSIYTSRAFLRSSDPNTSSSVITDRSWVMMSSNSGIRGGVDYTGSTLHYITMRGMGKKGSWVLSLKRRRPEGIMNGLPTTKPHVEEVLSPRRLCYRLPRLTALRFASPSEPSTLGPAPFPPTAPTFLVSEEKALPTTGMLSRRIQPPFDFSRSCGRRRVVSGLSA